MRARFLRRDRELRAVALRVVEHARETGNISVALRKELAQALGMDPVDAMGYHSRERQEARKRNG